MTQKPTQADESHFPLSYCCPECGASWSEDFDPEYGECNSECPHCEMSDIEPQE
jgi:hypothetical protein